MCWEHLGGELVLGQVFVDGELTEHHYWNRIDGEDLDITSEQFTGAETIREVDVLGSDEVRARQGGIRSELAARIEILRSGATRRLTADHGSSARPIDG